VRAINKAELRGGLVDSRRFGHVCSFAPFAIDRCALLFTANDETSSCCKRFIADKNILLSFAYDFACDCVIISLTRANGI